MLDGPANSCVLSLTGRPNTLTDVGVSFVLGDGRVVAVPHDSMNGWTYTDNAWDAIVFSGTSCVEIAGGTVSAIRWVYACSGMDPLIDDP